MWKTARIDVEIEMKKCDPRGAQLIEKQQCAVARLFATTSYLFPRSSSIVPLTEDSQDFSKEENDMTPVHLEAYNPPNQHTV